MFDGAKLVDFVIWGICLLFLTIALPVYYSSFSLREVLEEK